MSDLVERVARAIYEEDDPWHKAWPWPDLQSDQAGVDQYRRIAEAAIAVMQADTDLERIKRERDQAVEALRPFAEYGKWAVDENGWNLGSPREWLCDWFGPSDFHRAATTLASIEGTGHE